MIFLRIFFKKNNLHITHQVKTCFGSILFKIINLIRIKVVIILQRIVSKYLAFWDFVG
ncbi:hypothetical protein THIOM_002728 [Candidatus Thiomargarita nelsonii]|uniref:Uncharacterized protein n=1 Tax=Candidatus Thiomargarita nelsonii TaxID=1003181 RepID=A0A176S0B8_9GAMM|nr:hypothetical protein THIOM_002728 [Candidatus Thiomargarita nelsonii]